MLTEPPVIENLACGPGPQAAPGSVVLSCTVRGRAGVVNEPVLVAASEQP
ncbi:MAG: hypothetical protein ACLPVY_05345 [Acidimicrobiia bacterium]